MENEALLTLDYGKDKTEARPITHNGAMMRDTDAAPEQSAGGHRDTGRTMANDIFIESDSSAEGVAALSGTGHELDSLLGKAFEEKPIWVDLYESIRDVFFPPKLPPLELTSTPIPVPDRMAVKANPVAVGVSAVLNAGILALILLAGIKTVVDIAKKNTNVTQMNLTPPPTVPLNSTGGGGGQGDQKMETVQGHLPPKMEHVKVEQPKLSLDKSIEVQPDLTLPDNANLPMVGIKSSSNKNVVSGGFGHGGGVGGGSGTGLGSGSGWNYGGGAARVGGNISKPISIYTVDAEFSEEARRAKYQGECIVELIVDAQGNPQNVHVSRPIGMGLDENAIAAVKQFKFKPALKDGRTPVAVYFAVSIDFRIY